MIVFALDTSGPVAGVAVTENGQVRYEAMAVNAFTHSQSILPMLEEATVRTGIPLEKADLFAVTVGPGSFTGVRIGVSTVKGLCHATGKKAVAVDALEAMAAGVQPFDGVICPIQDARAGQVYGAAFEGSTLKRLKDDRPQKIEDYVAEVMALGQNMLFLGDGMPVFRDRITALTQGKALFAPAHLAYLRPASVAVLAERDAEQAVDYLVLQPLYLRAPQAERQKNLRELGHE